MREAERGRGVVPFFKSSWVTSGDAHRLSKNCEFEFCRVYYCLWCSRPRKTMVTLGELILMEGGGRGGVVHMLCMAVWGAGAGGTC